MSFPIALCQIVVLDDDRAGNLVRIEHALVEAKAQQAVIACFPEMSLYGWVNPNAHRLASAIPGADANRLCSLAKQYRMYLCIGLAEKEGGNLYDAAVLIDPDGSILLKHRKINLLSELMNPPYTPGNTVEIVETEFGKAGILICADTFKPEILEEMNKRKPDVVFVPYGWAEQAERFPEHGKKMADVISRAAKTIGATVIGTDAVGMILHGPWKGRVYGGQSAAADARGNILIRLKDRDRDLQTLTLF